MKIYLYFSFKDKINYLIFYLKIFENKRKPLQNLFSIIFFFYYFYSTIAKIKLCIPFLKDFFMYLFIILNSGWIIREPFFAYFYSKRKKAYF